MPNCLKKFWEWVSHGYTVWGILNIIFPTLGGVGGGIIAWVTSLHPTIIFFAVLGGIALGLFISNEIAARRISKRIKILPETIQGDKQPVVSFYINRTELAKSKGSLADLLSGHERVWAIFHTGEISKISGVLAKCRFERLILTDPRDEYMMKKLEPYGNNAEQYNNQIRQVAEIASKKGSDVHYYEGPIGNSLIIADKIKLADYKFSEQAWAQIETGIPFLSPQDRASFVVYNKDDGRNVFDAFLGHFKTMWGRSKPAPEEDLNYGRST